MDVGTERLSHLTPSNIGDSMKRQAVVELVIVQEILLDAVYNQMQKVVGLVEKQSDGEISNLLF